MGTHPSRARRPLVTVLTVTLLAVVVQLALGAASGSLALLADAGHMATDATGLAVALLGASLALRPPHDRRTFGWRRAEVLAALVNSFALLLVGTWVVVTALGRWNDPPPVDALLVVTGALIGIGANTVSLRVLRHSHGLNMRAARLEVLGDLLGSIAVLAAGIVVLTTGHLRADVYASLAVGTLIIPRAWSLLREVVDVLLEATPRTVDLEEVRTHILGVQGVVGVHDLHAWLISSGLPVLSAHVVIDNTCITEGRAGTVLDDLGECLAEHFAVEHCTFQLEPVGHRLHEAPHHD